MKIRQPWEVWDRKHRKLKWADRAIALCRSIKLPPQDGRKYGRLWTSVRVVTRGGGFCVYQPYPRKPKGIKYDWYGCPFRECESNPQLAYRCDRIGD